MRERTGDDVWRNLRPPLDALDERRRAERSRVCRERTFECDGGHRGEHLLARIG